MCRQLEAFKDKEKTMYPLDYETIYILFVGVLKNVSTARPLFEELRNMFEFDGAAAETIGEISYEIVRVYFP